MTDKTAGVGPVECHVRPDPADELHREIKGAWGMHAQRVHYSWPMGLGGYAALQSPKIMAEDGFCVAARQLVLADRRRLKALVEAVRDANAAAQGEDAFRLLMPRQQQAWDALMAALS